MAQHDYVIANGTGAAVRSDLNNALAAIVSLNSGATEPTTTYAYQLWADTSAGVLKLRDGANAAWITLRELDGTLTIEDGTDGAPGLAFADDLNTGIYSPGADQVAVATNGTERVEFGTSEVVFNDAGNNYDFRIEGDTNSSLFFVDASTDRVGIGTTSPGQALHVVGKGRFQEAASSGAIAFIGGDATAAYIDTGTFGAAEPLAFRIQTSEKARIDSSGRLLVGTSSAGAVGGQTAQSLLEGTNTPTSSLAAVCNANSTSGPLLLLGKSRGANTGGTTAVIEGDRLGAIFFTGANGTDLSNIGALIDCVVDAQPFTSGDTTDLPSRLVFSTTADGASTPTERVKISSTGITYIGNLTITTSSQQTTSPHLIVYTNSSTNLLAAGGYEANTTSTSTRHHISFTNPNGVVGSISTSASATAFNTSSDYRLKENVTPVTDGITRLQQLKPSRFNFIADPSKTVDGFIAHEVQTIVPEAITGEKDEVDEEGNPVYQGIDQSKIVPLLTAALQEAISEIESLKARLDAANL